MRQRSHPGNRCWGPPSLRMEAPADGLMPHGYRQWKLSGQEPFSLQSSTLGKPNDLRNDGRPIRNVYLKSTRKYLASNHLQINMQSLCIFYLCGAVNYSHSIIQLDICLMNNTRCFLTCRKFACVCIWQAPPCTSCLLHFWQPGSLRSTAADPPSHLLYSPGNWCSRRSYPALRDNNLLLPPSSLYLWSTDLRSKTTNRVTHRTDDQTFTSLTILPAALLPLCTHTLLCTCAERSCDQCTESILILHPHFL